MTGRLPPRLLLLLVGWVLAPSLWAQGHALEYASPAASLEVTAAEDLVPLAGLTVEAWARWEPEGVGGGAGILVVHGLYEGLDTYRLHRSGGRPAFRVRTRAGEVDLVGDTPFVAGQWMHVAGTYDGLHARLFVDGRLVDLRPHSGALLRSSGPLRIGNGGRPARDSWSGAIDEVRIWSYARDVAAIRRDRRTTLVRAAGLLASWPILGTVGDRAGRRPIAASLDARWTEDAAPTHGHVALPFHIAVGNPFTIGSGGFRPDEGVLVGTRCVGAAPGSWMVHGVQPPGTGPGRGRDLLVRWEDWGCFEHATSTAGRDGEIALSRTLPAHRDLLGRRFQAAALGTHGPWSRRVAASARVVPESMRLDAVVPPVADVLGGAHVLLVGAGLRGATVVLFDGVRAEVLASSSTTHVLVKVPPGPPGPVDVLVGHSWDARRAVLRDAFTYRRPLELHAVDPEVAPPGAIVRVRGRGFGRDSSLRIEGRNWPFERVDATEFTFRAPEEVRVDAHLVFARPHEAPSVLEWNPAPHVLAVREASGAAGGGGIFLVQGRDFHAGTRVSVGDAPARVISRTEDLLVVEAPPGAPGPAAILVGSVRGVPARARPTYLYE